MEIFLFLLAPFVASLILTGIHAYLGVHVVERGVIFVDLALAQIAALGATVGIAPKVSATIFKGVTWAMRRRRLINMWSSFRPPPACRTRWCGAI